MAGLSAAVILALLAGTAISTHFALQASGRAQEATERLWGAYLAQAQAGRRSGRVGQRFESLEAIAAAAAIRPSAELRDEAIACMGLVDLRVDGHHKVDYPINVRFAPDLARYVAYRGVGYLGDLSVRRMEDGRELFTLPNPGRRLGHLVFSPDGRLLAETYLCGNQAECHVWDLDNRRVVLSVPVSVGTPITSFCPHSRTLAVSAPNGFLHVCDVGSGQKVQILSTTDLQALSSEPPSANCLRFHPNGRWVAFFPRSSDFDRGPSTVDVFDLKTQHVVQRFPHPQGTFDVAWGPDGRLLAVACGDFNVHVWDVETGRLRALLRGHQAEVVATGFNRAGNLLVSTSLDGTLRLWDPMSGKELLQTGSVRHFHFSQDDLRLAYHSGESVGAWQVVRPECRTLHDASAVHKGPWSVDFGLEGRLLAAADSVRGVRLIDLNTGDRLASLELPDPGRISWLAFSPDGSRLAAAMENHRIQVWDLRSIRNRLAAMGLDWQLPAYAPEDLRDSVKPLSLELTLRSAEDRASIPPAPESQSAASPVAPTAGHSLPFRDLGDGANVQAWFLAAMAAWARGDKQHAYEWYAAALSFDASDWFAWNEKGLSHFRKGENDQAIACYSESIRLAPMLAAIYDNRGRSYAQKGDLDRAIADYTAAIRLVPKRCDSYINRSTAYTQRGELDQALADAREAVRLNPRSPQGHHQLAYLCIELGDYDEAVRSYSEVVRLAPTQSLSYNNRASARVARGRGTARRRPAPAS